MSKKSSLLDTPRNTASDLDLRKTKCELFNKLVEPNQMIVAPPSKTSSDENINSTARGSNKMEIVSSQGPTTSDQSDIMISDTEATSSDQELVMFTPTHNRWYTNEEIASILTSSRSHPEWLTNELKIRPSSGSCFLYNREKVRYRQDGYTWRKRRSGRTVREDHLRLKRQGIEFIYGNYVHSALLPSFHRRCYWLLESRENPNIILVHYLNQPPDDKSKMLLSFNPSLLEAETRRKWTNEEIIEEIGSVFGGISQIHHTLSINFPTTINIVNSGHGPTTTEVHLNGDSFQTQQQQHDMDSTVVDSNFVGQQNPPNNEERDTKVEVKAQVTEQQQHQQRNSSGQQLAATIYTPDIAISHLKQPDCHQNQNNTNSLINDRLVQDNNVIAKNDDGCEMMIIINQDSNNASDFNQHLNTQKSNIDNRVYISNNNNRCARNSNSESSANSFDVQQQGHSDDAMTFDIVQESTSTTEVDSRVGQELSGYEGKAISIDCTDGDLKDHQLNNDSKNFCDQTKSETGEPQMESGTCSPVTQIYNKIVDDIETYVLPLELNNFDPPNHLHHHHNHHQQHHHSSFDVLQSMDTGELDHQQKDSYRVRQRHSSSVSASQFIADNDFGLDRIDGTRNDMVDQDGGSDMLLADFNLTRNDGAPNHHTTEMSPSVVDSIASVDDMREMLMMGISSTQDQTDDVQQSNQLLLGCDPSDPLDLFNLKPLHSEPKHHHHHHHHLDVKSTTSETETLNRLSPTISMVPRCNSTDDAMQLSAQRLDQYQHHASSNYLRSTSDAQNEHLVNNFSQYNNHHHHNQNQDLIDNNAHRSATSTEPSNSTSCSASPSTSSLLNAATTSTGIGSCNQSGRFGYLNGRSTDGGSLSTGSAYNESSNNSSYMKLPLQQRQNSEQREPSNSVLSTLLPKALSLDGSDLSAHYYQNQQHRVSPIVGAYHASKGHHQRTASQRHTNSNMYATNQMAHPSAHMLLVGPSNNHQHQSSRHHYYQRPSAPSISPSSGTYSMDSSGSGVVGKVMATASQYRSVSVVATTMCHPQQQVQVSQQQQQQQHSMVESVGSHVRLLPILDYVPNWSLSSGGVKILIIGNWISLLANDPNRKQSVNTTNEGINGPFDSEQSHFSILFDDLSVPASLIQNNVLRCHSPQHKAGYIALKVLYKNLIVSEQVLFEIRAGECVESNSQLPSLGQSAVSQKDSSSLTNFNQMKTSTN